MMRWLVALALVWPTALQAQTVYGPDGRVKARVSTSSTGATTIYGADGRVKARTFTGSNGTTTVYGPDGRVQGTITPDRRHGR